MTVGIGVGIRDQGEEGMGKGGLVAGMVGGGVIVQREGGGGIGAGVSGTDLHQKTVWTLTLQVFIHTNLTSRNYRSYILYMYMYLE